MSAPEKQELLPCPLCLGEIRLIDIVSHEQDYVRMTGAVVSNSEKSVLNGARCKSCGMVFYAKDGGFKQLWNTRAPTKPKSGGVNLFLTRGEFNLLQGLLDWASKFFEADGQGGRCKDLLTVIQSQSKESSNDS